MGIIERAVLAELSSVRLGKIFERTYISLGKGWLVAESGRFKHSKLYNGLPTQYSTERAGQLCRCVLLPARQRSEHNSCRPKLRSTATDGKKAIFLGVCFFFSARHTVNAANLLLSIKEFG